jgi:uncharacterized protein YukE
MHQQQLCRYDASSSSSASVGSSVFRTDQKASHGHAKRIQELQEMEERLNCTLGNMKAFHDRFDQKAAELDEKQQSLHRRISSASDEHEERMNEFHDKLTSFDDRLVAAEDQHEVRVKELNDKAKKIDVTYSKVSNMLQRAQSAVSKVGDVVDSALLKIDDARFNLIESAKNSIAGIVGSVLGDMRSISLPTSVSFRPATTAETPSSKSEDTSSVLIEVEPAVRNEKKTSKRKRTTPAAKDSASDGNDKPKLKRARKTDNRGTKKEFSSKQQLRSASMLSPIQPRRITRTVSSCNSKQSCAVTPCEKGILTTVENHKTPLRTPTTKKRSSAPTTKHPKKTRGRFGGTKRGTRCRDVMVMDLSFDFSQ